jgi:hypothetical protein
MKIEPSTIADFHTIFEFYDLAVAYQKFNKHWMGFDADLVLKEITETRQWKIVIDDNSLHFAITFEDKAFGKKKIVIKPFIMGS